MTRPLLQAYRLLLQIEWHMQLCDLQSIHLLVRRRPVRSRSKSQRPEHLCRAVDTACAFHFKTVLCLQRSATATLLLRSYGYPAELVIGAQMMPFRSHAWVEIDGLVVNDKPYMNEMYQVLERC
jgi:hypothetical protein